MIPSSRLFFLDWLRVIAFALLVFYHAGLIFVDWGFHIRNDFFSEVLKLPMLFVNQWRLPLLFFVSGAGIYFALGKRTAAAFAKERFVRIFVPLVAGIIFVIPPQLYFQWKQAGVFLGSYWDFYPVFFTHITWNHLWFLVYLFAFTFLALPAFLYFRGGNGRILISSFSRFLTRRFNVLLLVIPLILIEIFLRDHWPDNRNLVTDWYNFTFYFTIMMYGYIFASSDRLWIAVERNRWLYLVLWLGSFCVIFFGWHNSGINFLETFTGGRLIFDFFKCLTILSAIFYLLGTAKVYLNRDSRALRYANKAVYPFFILHQTTMIIIGYYVVQLNWSILPKYIVIVGGTFIITLLLYEGLIRRLRTIGFLFGTKGERSNS